MVSTHASMIVQDSGTGDILQSLSQIQAAVWGVPLSLLLVGTGLYLTLLLRGLQFRKLPNALYLAFFKGKEEGGEGDITHFQALMTALAATVGTGNIVGVATAIAAGGPGALFWMWVTGLVGMATKYSEAVLGVRFRETDDRGEKSGGPMYYLENGIRWGGVGRTLAVAFALFASVAAFGIGNGVQSQGVADAIHGAFGVSPLVVGLVTATLAGAVILGGIKSIGKVTGVLVPVMIVMYLGAAAVIIGLNIERVPEAFRLIFEGAFSGTAAAGGVIGFSVAQAMRFGIARGVFSNESGLGTGAIAAAAAKTTEPCRQALISMTQTFIDTLVVCTFTGVAIISTGAWDSGESGVRITQQAFSTGLPGEWGGAIVAVCLTFFAFSTMLGWSYYGEKSLEYLAGSRTTIPYRIVFIVMIAVSAVAELDMVWLVSDILNALMALPNLIGLILLSGVVLRETRSYFQRNP